MSYKADFSKPFNNCEETRHANHNYYGEFDPHCCVPKLGNVEPAQNLDGRLLGFYERRKYVNKSEKRRTRGFTTKQFGLLTTGSDIHLMTRNRTVLTSWASVSCTFTKYYSRKKCLFYSVSRVSVILVPANPTIHCPWEANPFLSLKGNNFAIFFIMSSPKQRPPNNSMCCKQPESYPRIERCLVKNNF